jgi:hypothetical protein
MGGLLEQVANLFVGGLGEVFIPHSNRCKWMWGGGANHLIHFFPNFFAGLAGSHRNGSNDAVGALGA